MTKIDDHLRPLPTPATMGSEEEPGPARLNGWKAFGVTADRPGHMIDVQLGRNGSVRVESTVGVVTTCALPEVEIDYLSPVAAATSAAPEGYRPPLGGSPGPHIVEYMLYISAGQGE